MSERNRSDPDRLYLLAIVLYALLALGFLGYYLRWLFA
jgi:nitrate reductase NapE component